VLDPIDGTKSFITGRPLFGTLIALAHAGRPVLGVIDQSILAERWVGVAGRGRGGTAARPAPAPCGSLADATLFCTSPKMFKAPAEAEGFAAVESAVRLPMYGGDCYAYGLLASGFADLVSRPASPPTTTWRSCRWWRVRAAGSRTGAAGRSGSIRPARR
jgi:inositol-phosphate phosphatase/L-galactose 1-phosphate phosphatase/histidinol-phosphatase